LGLRPTAPLRTLDSRGTVPPSNATLKAAFPERPSTAAEQVWPSEATSPAQAQQSMKRFKSFLPYGSLQLLREEQLGDSTAASSFKGQHCSCPWMLPSMRGLLLTLKVVAAILEAKRFFCSSPSMLF